MPANAIGASAPQQIGKVRIRYIGTPDATRPVYSDGAVEEKLQQMFAGQASGTPSGEDASSHSWAEEYHLSTVRHNLLKWYPFNGQGSLLEIGAGCGALTGLFCDKVSRVVALEYSPRRAGITALRFAGRSNLEMVVGAFQDFETTEQFDYVTIIGVLEYAAEFYGGRNPYESFLQRAAQLLRPGGHLLLAIENKIGLKYITGAAEDHTGRPFDSVYNYPHSKNVRTFSKMELGALLHAADFQKLDWYYPLPDYKLPHAVLSEAVNPKDTDSIWSLAPATLPHLPRREVLSEKLLGQTLAQAGLFGEFANSFLVVASKDAAAEETRCLRFFGSNHSRRPAYRTCVSIRMEAGAKKVVKIADNRQAEEFMCELPQREQLARSFFAGRATVVTGALHGAEMSYPHLEYPTLKELIGRAMADEDWPAVQHLLDQYLEFVRGLPAHDGVPEKFLQEFAGASAASGRTLRCLDVAPVDCIPANILVGPDGWHIIDSEWTLPFPMPVDYLIFRAIHALTHDLQFYIQKSASVEHPVVRLCGLRHPHYIPAPWFELLNQLQVSGAQLAQWEVGFQKLVLLSPPSRRTFWFPLTRRRLTRVKIQEVGRLSDLRFYAQRIRRRLVALVRLRRRRPALQPILAPSA